MGLLCRIASEDAGFDSNPASPVVSKIREMKAGSGRRAREPGRAAAGTVPRRAGGRKLKFTSAAKIRILLTLAFDHFLFRPWRRRLLP